MNTLCLISDPLCVDENGNVINGPIPSSDPCESCQCIDGQPECFIIDCARPPCDNPITLPDECCPTCPGRYLDILKTNLVNENSKFVTCFNH